VQASGVCPRLLNARVLVADGNATNRVLVRKLLVSDGCRPEEAADLESVFVRLQGAVRAGDPFQIALLDTKLPSVSGEQLRECIAADPQLRSTALVLMTDFGQFDDSIRRKGPVPVVQVSNPIWEQTLRDALLAVSSTEQGQATSNEIVVQPSRVTPAKHHARILLAEDNQTNQMVAVRDLEKTWL
jgi:two-component system, sensor histidine kinase and response regulator